MPFSTPPRTPGVIQAPIPDSARRRRRHPVGCLPVAALVVLAILAHRSGLDPWLADRIYAAQGQRWLLRQHVLTSAILHDGGRLLSQLAWAGVVIAWLASRRIDGLRPRRAALGRLALSVLLSTASIAALKQLVPVHCPWDLLRYGGTAIAGEAGGACFPSGHASAGYAWMALARVRHAPRWRRAGLACGIAAGLLFGLTQQWRGAHFLSHDLWAAALCWTVTVVVMPSANRTAT